MEGIAKGFGDFGKAKTFLVHGPKTELENKMFLKTPVCIGLNYFIKSSSDLLLDKSIFMSPVPSMITGT